MCIQTATDGKYARKKKPVKFILNIKTAPDCSKNTSDALTTERVQTPAPNNFLLQLVPAERLFITTWQIGWSAFVRVVRSLFQRGEGLTGLPLDVIFLGNTFAYQLGDDGRVSHECHDAGPCARDLRQAHTNTSLAPHAERCPPCVSPVLPLSTACCCTGALVSH